MAGRGFAPSGRQPRGKAKQEPPRELVNTGELHGPELPEGVDWHPQTVKLWDSLRRSPLLADEPELGWMFLIDTMLMHSTMWEKGRWEFASEVRLRLAKFGATPEDRARLKVKVTTPVDQPKPAPADTLARRRALRIADGA